MTNDDWQTLLDRDPADAALRLQYSDWLEEQGRAGAEAEVQRWLARNRRWPNCTPCDWEWWLEGKGDLLHQRFSTTVDPRLVHRCLPARLFARLPSLSRRKTDRPYRTYATRREAEAALVIAWRALEAAGLPLA